MLCLQPATCKTTVGAKFCSFTLVHVHRDCAETTQEMDYHRCAKQNVSATIQQCSPKVVERRVKAKSQLKQVNKKLQPYILKMTSGVCFLWKSHCFLKKNPKLSWKLKYICPKCPFVSVPHPGVLQNSWISPASNQGFQYNRRTSKQLVYRESEANVQIPGNFTAQDEIFQVWTQTFHERKMVFRG